MGEYRQLDVKVISAEGIKNVNFFTKMDVFAVVWILGYPKKTQKTHVDKRSGTTPRWNHRATFSVDEECLYRPSLHLIIQLKSHRALGNREIGEVSVPINDLFRDATCNGGDFAVERVVEYQVRTPSGRPKGTLKISYKFGEKYGRPGEPTKNAAPEPVMAYPAAPGGGGGSMHAMSYPPPPPYAFSHGHEGYPPPPAAYGGYPPAEAHGYGGYVPPRGAPQGYYGYPQPHAAYGYGPIQQGQPGKKKSKMGAMGALGLGAGLIGGMMVGEMVSDIGEMNEGFED